jgi:hypothetical protein
LSAEASEALGSPLAIGAVPLRAFAAPYKLTQRDASVIFSIEVDAASLGLVERNGVFQGELEVGILPTDDHGAVRRGEYDVSFLLISLKVPAG